MPIQHILNNPLNKLLGAYYFRQAVRKSGFWFVDIPRTGSSSIRHNLALSYGFPHAKSKSHKLMYLPCHTAACEVRKRIGLQDWTKIFTFSFVRNPYHRFASLYQHFRFREKTWNKSFADLVGELSKYRHEKDSNRKPMFAWRQVDYLYDENQNIIVSFVGKYENRHRDLNIIINKLKLKTWTDAIQAPSLQKPILGFNEMYSDELQNMVYDYFFEDFKTFHYKNQLKQNQV